MLSPSLQSHPTSLMPGGSMSQVPDRPCTQSLAQDPVPQPLMNGAYVAMPKFT